MTSNKTTTTAKKPVTPRTKKAASKPTVKKPTIAELTLKIKDLEGQLIKKSTEVLNLEDTVKTLEERSLFGEFWFRISKNFR